MVILASPNTALHSPKDKLVVIMWNWRIFFGRRSLTPKAPEALGFLNELKRCRLHRKP